MKPFKLSDCNSLTHRSRVPKGIRLTDVDRAIAKHLRDDLPFYMHPDAPQNVRLVIALRLVQLDLKLNAMDKQPPIPRQATFRWENPESARDARKLAKALKAPLFECRAATAALRHIEFGFRQQDFSFWEGPILGIADYRPCSKKL